MGLGTKLNQRPGGILGESKKSQQLMEIPKGNYHPLQTLQVGMNVSGMLQAAPGSQFLRGL